jgi:hypothetical protein
MRSKLKKTALGLISSILTGFVGNFMIRTFSRGLRKESLGELTDECLYLLLRGMGLAFFL